MPDIHLLQRTSQRAAANRTTATVRIRETCVIETGGSDDAGQSHRPPEVSVWMAVEIVSRDMWHALSGLRTLTESLGTPVRHVFLLNTQTKPCRSNVYCKGMVRRIQQFHMNMQNQPDVRYNFLVGGDGTIYEGRGWDAPPGLPRRYRPLTGNSITIAYIGHYTAETVPKVMLDACHSLINHGVSSNLIARDHDRHEIMQGDETSSSTHSAF